MRRPFVQQSFAMRLKILRSVYAACFNVLNQPIMHFDW